MKHIAFLFMMLLAVIANQSTAQSSATPETPALTYQIIDSQNNTFGYDVYRDGKLLIHQTSIPALPGNDGFKTRDDAARVAELVMYKIRKGEMPPTITAEEMKELGVLK
jgi:hypothetical protein